MEYLYVVWEGGQGAEESDRSQIMGEMMAYTAQLGATGKLRGGGPLPIPFQAKTVRRRGGEVTVTDGPYIETKEVIGGYMVVEAASLDEAVELARDCPAARRGGIEVREILPMGPPR